MKRVAAGALLPTPWLFEPAKRPDDRADYCLDILWEWYDIAPMVLDNWQIEFQMSPTHLRSVYLMYQIFQTVSVTCDSRIWSWCCRAVVCCKRWRRRRILPRRSSSRTPYLCSSTNSTTRTWWAFCYTSTARAHFSKFNGIANVKTCTNALIFNIFFNFREKLEKFCRTVIWWSAVTIRKCDWQPRSLFVDASWTI